MASPWAQVTKAAPIVVVGRRPVGRRSVVAVAKAEVTIIEVAGRVVPLSRPDKVLFAERGETKLDLVELLPARSAEPLMRDDGRAAGAAAALPERRRRHVVLPEAGPRRTRPTGCRRRSCRTPNGTTSQALVAADLAHVVWAVNLGCLGFHVVAVPRPTTRARRRAAHRPRPQPGRRLRRGPRGRGARCEALLDELGHRAATPRPPATAASTCTCACDRAGTPTRCARAAVAVARELERRRPDLITAAWWKEERGERVFIDFNQNAPHKTVFGAWSVRARPGAQVSTPFRWDELDDIHPDELTIAHRARRGSARAATRGRRSTTSRSRSSRCWRCARRDRAAGLLDAPWPPVYPKMPGEPPRVAPSRARKA